MSNKCKIWNGSQWNLIDCYKADTVGNTYFRFNNSLLEYSTDNINWYNVETFETKYNSSYITASNVNIGDVININSYGQIQKATNGLTVHGVCLETKISPNPAIVCLAGIASGLSNLTANTTYYCNRGNGALTTIERYDQSNLNFKVGIAISNTELLLSDLGWGVI